MAEVARTVALALPDVEEGSSYGTPAFRVRGKLFVRFHQDGESLVVRSDLDAREMLVRSKPKAFYVTDHYERSSWVLVRLAKVSKSGLREVIERAWRDRAPSALVARSEGCRADQSGDFLIHSSTRAPTE